jgi:ubiquinone/menaquinone biosynthesis C-methylase UbiE
MINLIVAQFGQPKGLAGRVVGMIMARKNRERIAWAVSLLDVQPEDHLLEVGFGPGVAIQQVAQLAKEGFVAGIDHSAIMVAQASRRNAKAIAAGRVELIFGSVAALSYGDASFDKAFAINSLRFWPAPVECLRGLGRVLKPRGHVAIVSQPYGAKSDSDVYAEGNKIGGQLAEAGYVQIEQRLQAMTPIGAVCVIGVKA